MYRRLPLGGINNRRLVERAREIAKPQASVIALSQLHESKPASKSSLIINVKKLFDAAAIEWRHRALVKASIVRVKINAHIIVMK